MRFLDRLLRHYREGKEECRDYGKATMLVAIAFILLGMVFFPGA